MFFFIFSIMIHHRILNIVSCGIQQDLVVYPFYIYQIASANSKLLIHPSFLLGNHKPVLYVCEFFPVSYVCVIF